MSDLRYQLLGLRSRYSDLTFSWPKQHLLGLCSGQVTSRVSGLGLPLFKNKLDRSCRIEPSRKQTTASYLGWRKTDTWNYEHNVLRL